MSDGVIKAIIGGVATVIAAVIAKIWPKGVVPPIKGVVPPIKGFEFSGRYQGENSLMGWVYDCTIHLQVIQSQITGQINWTLKECPPGNKLAKSIGSSAVEFVRGFLEGSRITISGYQVDNPRLLEMDEYSLAFREDLETFDGSKMDQSRRRFTGIVL